MKYDYLIVGAGLYGCTIARLLTDAGYKCLIVEKHNYIGGGCHDYPLNNKDAKYEATVHEFGPHIIHTSDEDVINFLSKYVKLNHFIANTIALDDDNKLYHLPFNANTFYDIFGVSSIKEINDIIEKERVKIDNPKNLEEKALSLIGPTIYNKMIKEYTKKQWNKDPKELPADIIIRIPIRMYYNNNYFFDEYQGIPIGGYTKMFYNIIDGIDCRLGYDINEHKDDISKYKNVIYCGAVDELLNYKLGVLEYRSLKFEHKTYTFDYKDSQGNAVTNLIGKQRGTRIIDHIWFTPELVESYIGKTVVKTLEVPDDWDIHKERYYPINDDKNNSLYDEYVKLLKVEYPNITLGGRIGKYKYFDMDDTIKEAMKDFKKLTNK